MKIFAIVLMLLFQTSVPSDRLTVQPNFAVPMIARDPSYPLVIYDHDKIIVRISMNGTVEFGEGFTADEASKKAWEILAKYVPCREAQK